MNTQEDQEPVIDPERPIIDCHHHLWMRPSDRYLIDEFLEDVNTGHNIVATVYIQCESMYRAGVSGPERWLGETEFANGVAAMSASGLFGSVRLNSAIVSYADLFLGDAVTPALERHIDAGGGRFRGVRHPLVWDHDRSLKFRDYVVSEDMMSDTRFVTGMRCLGKLGLSFEAFVLHPQLLRLADLAASVPETLIVLNHLGTPTHIGRFTEATDVFESWRQDMRELAFRPNVFVKLGGLSMHWVGLPFDTRIKQPASAELADAWRPYIDACIEAFGTDRCMFESNFPPDRVGTAYPHLWNAFKRISANLGEAEKHDLFFGTAARVYRISV